MKFTDGYNRAAAIARMPSAGQIRERALSDFRYAVEAAIASGLGCGDIAEITKDVWLRYGDVDERLKFTIVTKEI